MIHSVNSINVSHILNNIEPKLVIVPAFVSLTIYIIPKIFSKIFPKEELKSGLFWHYRNNFAKFEDIIVKKKFPQIYHFIHSSLKDNLALVSFIATIIILKNPNKKKSKLVILGATILSCSILDTLRNAIYLLLLEISIKCHNNSYFKVAKRINEVALRIRQSL